MESNKEKQLKKTDQPSVSTIRKVLCSKNLNNLILKSYLV